MARGAAQRSDQTYPAAVSTYQTKVMPSLAVAPGTQGAAIDWRLRMLAAPAVDVELPWIEASRNLLCCVIEWAFTYVACAGHDRK